MVMKKITSILLGTLLLLLMLSGCNTVGNKTASMTIIYGAASVLSLLLLVGYCCFIKKRELWFLLLFASVFVVNTGYFTLSVSHTLEEALLANRISYLGSAFLPLSMLMTILNLSRLRCPKWIPGILLGITICVFLIAASPGYLDIYYKSVSLTTINGVSSLVKEYGPWHSVYLYYLLLYFASMIGATLYAVTTKRIQSGIQANILLIAVFVNLCVWLLEQLVDVNFEFLSISYIISELFLIGIYIMIQEHEQEMQSFPSSALESVGEAIPSVPEEPSKEYLERCSYLKNHLQDLTPTEHTIFEYYLAGKTTKEIMAELYITENTLKFHNKNIYGKLGVSSRKQLIEYATASNSES